MDSASPQEGFLLSLTAKLATLHPQERQQTVILTVPAWVPALTSVADGPGNVSQINPFVGGLTCVLSCVQSVWVLVIYQLGPGQREAGHHGGKVGAKPLTPESRRQTVNFIAAS